MRFRGEVTAQETLGDEGRIIVSNLKRVAASPGASHLLRAVAFDIPLSQLKTFFIGRIVEVTLTPKWR